MMLVFWKIRYLDARDKKFKDRNLWLDTGSLDPVTKAAVELCNEVKDSGSGRNMLRYRHLFREYDYSRTELNERFRRHGSMSSVCLPDYAEDENGNELTNKQMAVILTGNPNANMFAAGAKQHDIDYVLADRRPVPIDQISLCQEQLNVLGYFDRDLREMLASAFYRDGPGTLTRCGDKFPRLQTAVTDEEISSFVMIFRRLYMKSEPAGFLKAVSLFSNVIEDYPLCGWIKGVGGQYEKELAKKPDFVPFAGGENCCFSRKRLIDVFLYTQYAHQPDERRARQFQECLASVGGRRPLLMWLFLTELRTCSLHMRNAGVIIADFYDRYCQYHKVSCDVIMSMCSNNPGIGTLEKKESRQARILREKAEELAMTIWKNSGRPEGGPTHFINQALEQLKAAVTGKIDVRKE